MLESRWRASSSNFAAGALQHAWPTHRCVGWGGRGCQGRHALFPASESTQRQVCPPLHHAHAQWPAFMLLDCLNAAPAAAAAVTITTGACGLLTPLAAGLAFACIAAHNAAEAAVVAWLNAIAQRAAAANGTRLACGAARVFAASALFLPLCMVREGLVFVCFGEGRGASCSSPLPRPCLPAHAFARAHPPHDVHVGRHPAHARMRTRLLGRRRVLLVLGCAQQHAGVARRALQARRQRAAPRPRRVGRGARRGPGWRRKAHCSWPEHSHGHRWCLKLRRRT